MPTWGPPPRPRGPTADFGRRLGARSIDAVLEAAAGIVILVLMSGARRPYAALLIVAVALTAYETVGVALAGGTVGKLLVGLRVVELDRAQGVSWAAALRRGWALGPLLALVLPIPGLLASTGLSPLHRGLQDRLAGTYVVDRHLARSVTRAALVTIAEIEMLQRATRWGWAAPLPARRRGRLHRLDDAPLLVAGLLALTLLALFGRNVSTVVLLTSGPWLVLFVVDETRRVARTGQTAGHRRFGLVVIDTVTGEAPGVGRSFVRALYLGLALYVPVAGWLLLLAPDVITMVASDDRRALHDRLARTVVVVDPMLPAPAQRAASLALDQDDRRSLSANPIP